jgi:hypothetical protein
VTDASASVSTCDLGVGRSAYAAAGASRGSRNGVKSGMPATVVAVSLMLLASACLQRHCMVEQVPKQLVVV